MPPQVIKPLVFDLQSQIRESIDQMKVMLAELNKHKSPTVRLAAMAEMRHHIEMATRAMEIATRTEAIREFQAGILDALAEAAVPVRIKIIGLFEARANEEQQLQ